MLVLRLLTNCNREDYNDKYAGRVVKDFSSYVNDIEVTFICDSLGATFFVKKKTDIHVTARRYAEAIDYLNTLVRVAFSECRIVDDLRIV